MVVSRSLLLLLLLSLLSLTDASSVFEMFGPSKDLETCSANIQKEMNSTYPTMLTILLIVGPLVSVLLLVFNVVLLLQLKKKLVAETELAMQKSFEVIDNVLVELMPRKIQKQLQTAINGGKSTAKTETKESGEGEQSAVSQVSVQK